MEKPATIFFSLLFSSSLLLILPVELEAFFLLLQLNFRHPDRSWWKLPLRISKEFSQGETEKMEEERRGKTQTHAMLNSRDTVTETRE